MEGSQSAPLLRVSLEASLMIISMEKTSARSVVLLPYSTWRPFSLYIKYNFMCSSIVLNAKFDTYPMHKTIPAQENAGLVADDFFEMLH